MTIDQERTYIMQHPKYRKSEKWRSRVMRMPDPQVHAIFMQFQKADYHQIEKELKQQEKVNKNYHQISIFEYMEGEKKVKTNIWKFFLETAPAIDVQLFCELTDSCLVIFNEHEMRIEKEYGR